MPPTYSGMAPIPSSIKVSRKVREVLHGYRSRRFRGAIRAAPWAVLTPQRSGRDVKRRGHSRETGLTGELATRNRRGFSHLWCPSGEVDLAASSLSGRRAEPRASSALLPGLREGVTVAATSSNTPGGSHSKGTTRGIARSRRQ